MYQFLYFSQRAFSNSKTRSVDGRAGKPREERSEIPKTVNRTPYVPPSTPETGDNRATSRSRSGCRLPLSFHKFGLRHFQMITMNVNKERTTVKKCSVNLINGWGHNGNLLAYKTCHVNAEATHHHHHRWSGSKPN